MRVREETARFTDTIRDSPRSGGLSPPGRPPRSSPSRCSAGCITSTSGRR